MGCLFINEGMFANCILFVTFCSTGALVPRRKTWHYSARKNMELLLCTYDTTHFASMLQLVHFDFFVTKCVGNVDAFCIKLKFLVQNASTL